MKKWILARHGQQYSTFQKKFKYDRHQQTQHMQKSNQNKKYVTEFVE